jgi:hypothetical protein
MSNTHIPNYDSRRDRGVRLYYTPRGLARALRLLLARSQPDRRGCVDEQAYLAVLDEIMDDPGPVCEHLALIDVIAALTCFALRDDRDVRIDGFAHEMAQHKRLEAVRIELECELAEARHQLADQLDGSDR